MISGIKICGVSDIKTLNYIINHPSPPQYVGFITNYKKSKRYVNFETLKQLTSVKKKKIKVIHLATWQDVLQEYSYLKKISKKDKINIEEFLKSIGVRNLKSST